MTGTTEYVIFYRNGADPLTEAGRSFGVTGRDAIESWLASENDESPLAECDVAAVASWALYREHYNGAES